LKTVPIRFVLLGCTLVFTAQIMTVRASAPDVDLSARVKITKGERQSEASHAENVVVWLNPADPQASTRPFPPSQPRLIQHHKSFEPHVLVVPVGAVVDFPNHDPFFHNVFSLFEGKRFDLGLYEAGTTRKVSFDRPGISYIFCNIHAEMSAVVIALDSPYYSISNRRGEIVIPRVPPGRYTMHVWYETALPATLAAMSREIAVTPETSTLGLLQIPASPIANAHKNKYGMDYEPPTPDTPGYEQP
jgi:plastocyanin